MVVAGLLLSAVLANFLILIHNPAPTLQNLDGHTLGVLGGMVLGTSENLLLCLLFGAALSIITRSAAFGIAAGFGCLIGEDIAAQILPVLGKSVHTSLGNQVVTLLYYFFRGFSNVDKNVYKCSNLWITIGNLSKSKPRQSPFPLI